jgi:hypothetical protein
LFLFQDFVESQGKFIFHAYMLPGNYVSYTCRKVGVAHFSMSALLVIEQAGF